MVQEGRASCSRDVTRQPGPTSSHSLQAPAAGPSGQRMTMLHYGQRDAVTKAEIRLCLLAAVRHQSTRDIGSLVSLLPDMFPDSDIASKVQLQKSKVNYSVVFGLGPFFAQQLQDTVSACDVVALGFDESLNKVSQKQQMDIFVRYWDSGLGQVSSRYLNSVFLGKSAAINLIEGFETGASQAKVNVKRQVVQVSMDGPNVNKAFLRQLKCKLKAEGNPEDPELLDFGTCGLHKVHGAFKTGCTNTGWKLVEFLRALFNLFKNVPSRRADFTAITGTCVFPQKFCAIRWVENKIVAVRAQQILTAVENYVKEVERIKKEQEVVKPKPKVTIAIPCCHSYQVVCKSSTEKMLRARLAFFETMAAQVEPFLIKFQSDAPLAPFLYTSLQSMIRQLMAKFVKPNVLEKQTIFKIDLSDNNNLLPPEKVDLGYGTKKALSQCDVTHKDIMAFRTECHTFMKTMVSKILDHTPLAYSFTKGITCLDPEVAINTDLAKRRLHIALTHLTTINRFTGHEADAIANEFQNLLEVTSVKEILKQFDVDCDRIDKFWMMVIGDKKGYENVKKFVKFVCILFHGNASLERGFSDNSSLLVENVTETSLIALRTVHDAIKVAGGVGAVNITKQLIHCFRNAHSRYSEALEEKKAAEKSAKEDHRKRKEVKEKLRELQLKKAKLMESAEKEASLIEQEVLLLKSTCV